MRIELLAFEGCPNLEPARELLQAGMASLGITGEVRDPRIKRDSGIVACGCLHDEIA